MVDPPPLVRPVEGPVRSRFTYDRARPFEVGRRRVVRFRVARGTPVRAPCRGRVAHAGPVPGGAAVTVRCAGWSATLTGVRPRVQRGRRVGRGTRIAVSTGRPVGLGLRRTADRFGYVDPLPLLRDARPAEPFVPLGPAPRARPTAPDVVPAARPAPTPVARPAPGVRPVPTAAPGAIPASGPPPLAWVGLALAALGLPAGVAGIRVRRRHATVRASRRVRA